MQILNSYIEGFIMSAGLIIAIGAQNAFLLKQSIRGEHNIITAWICAISDAILIAAGIAGLGILFNAHPLITKIVSLAGSVYLAWFALKSFINAYHGETMEIENGENNRISLKEAVLSSLAFTYLNPHCYLDTVVMLGSVGASRAAEFRLFFGIGAVTASFIWFFTLAYSGSVLAPLFRKEISWRVLDTGIGIVMLYIAYSLLSFGLSA